MTEPVTRFDGQAACNAGYFDHCGRFQRCEHAEHGTEKMHGPCCCCRLVIPAECVSCGRPHATRSTRVNPGSDEGKALCWAAELARLNGGRGGMPWGADDCLAAAKAATK